MFTGIIEGVGKVKSVTPQKNGGLSLTIAAPRGWNVKAGASVSVNGVCSTAKRAGTTLSFEYMPETLARSNLASLSKGSDVNLERSLRASARLDGHIVQGHVDTVGTITAITDEGNSQIFSISVPKGLKKYLAPKGSVALEGISLTIVDVRAASFTVKVLPYTLAHTNLHMKRKGAMLNIEFDILAKYLDSLIRST